MDIAHPRGPQHSLAYLHFLATKRKRRQDGADGEAVLGDSANVNKDGSGESSVVNTGKGGKDENGVRERSVEDGGFDGEELRGVGVGAKRARTAQVAPPLASEILGKLLSSVEVS